MDKVPSIEEAREKAGEALGSAKSAVQEGVGTAREKLGTIRDGASGQLKQGAERAQTAAKERYGQAVDGLKDGYSKAQKDLGHLNEDVNEYVRANPGRAIAIAAGAGFVLGLLLRGGGRYRD